MGFCIMLCKKLILFEPVCINEFVPDIPWKKYEYLKGLSISSKTVRCTYTGGYQNLDFAWRVPNSFDDASLISSNIKVREKISAD